MLNNDVFFLDIILKVRPLVNSEVQNVRDEGTLISFLYPAQNQDLIKQLAAKKVNAFGKLYMKYICVHNNDDLYKYFSHVDGYSFSNGLRPAHQPSAGVRRAQFDG